MNAPYLTAMMIWISDLKDTRLPYRGAALVYKFLGHVMCETDLEWTFISPKNGDDSIVVSADKKRASTNRGDCSATWVVTGKSLDDTRPSYFQVKFHEIGKANSYCAVGVVESNILSSAPLGTNWTGEKCLMFCNTTPEKTSWDAVVNGKNLHKAWRDAFQAKDLVTFLFIPTERILAAHCKRWGRGGVRVARIGPLPKPSGKKQERYHVMFGAAMKKDSVCLGSKKVALPKPLQELLLSRSYQSTMPKGVPGAKFKTNTRSCG